MSKHTPEDALMIEASEKIAELRGERDRYKSQLATADQRIVAMTDEHDALVAALEELLAAADAATAPDGDDVACMLRYGEADEQARAALAQYRGEQP